MIVNKEMESEKNSNKSIFLSGALMTLGLMYILLGPRLLPQMIFLSILFFLMTNKRYIWLDIIFKTLPRDLLQVFSFFYSQKTPRITFDQVIIFSLFCRALVRFSRLKYNIWLWQRNNSTVPKLFQEICRKHSKKIAFYYENNAWTYQQVNEYSNQIGHYFKEQGFKKGDAVALYMENSIEFMCLWLGLSKIGIVTALINTNLSNQSLLHSIKSANCLALIYSSELSVNVKEVESHLQYLKLYFYNRSKNLNDFQPQLLGNCIDLTKILIQASKSDLTKEIKEGKSTDKLLFIYTSGTTGMPKAAVINNNRYLFMSYGVRVMLNIQENDVIYNPLPLYHTSGVVVAAGQSILGGTTVAIRKKFSASNFWQDCIKYNCTVACYIGEICRYLLAVPEKPHDKQHNVRLMFGNGLRPQIWRKFVSRFQVKQIGEFYGATEGISNLVNIDNKIGTVGFVPRLAGPIYPVTLIKINQETEQPIRNLKGFCIRCEPGEPGMFIGKINPNKPLNSFLGYADKVASEKKILRNVFSKGDQYFNTGDILVMDNYGYFSFMDRTGDTFRWKGENVATSEVEAVISNIVGFNDAIAYGVEIPHVEGRAGMVAILDTNNTLNLKEFNEKLQKMLPTYARPLFIRIINDVPLTGTYKLKKKELQFQGYDINIISDPIYFYDSQTKHFELLTTSLYNDIRNGAVYL